MPFENFYKKSDKADHSWQLTFGIILIGLFFFFSISLFVSEFLQQIESGRKISTDSGRKQRVDKLCGSVPTPEGFQFFEKNALTETPPYVSIGYSFRSLRPKEEVYPIFIVWFAENGWTDNKPTYDALEFGKGNQSISISRHVTVTSSPDAATENTFYKIDCLEWIKN